MHIVCIFDLTATIRYHDVVLSAPFKQMNSSHLLFILLGCIKLLVVSEENSFNLK